MPFLTQRVQPACRRLTDSHAFQLTIFAVILVNAVVLGLGTYDSIDAESGDTLFRLNEICLGIFIVEILIRIAAYGNRPLDYFREGWNVFDFVVVFAVFIPGVRENALLLRLVRLLRIVRIVSIFPDLRVLVSGMGKALRPIGAMAALTLLLLFVYGMVGVQLFGDELPERWGNVGSAMLTLFTVLTLEGWNDVLFTAQEVTRFAWIFFVSFVLIASFLVINVLIAIIITAVEEAREAERVEEIEERLNRAAEEGKPPDPLAALIDRVGEMRTSLHELEVELGSLDLSESGRSPWPETASRTLGGPSAAVALLGDPIT
ncbi:MAG: ion transporter, partial [Solirubrobacterales bacterium]